MQNNLVDLFGEEDKQILQTNKILIIDASNIAYRTVYTSIFLNPDDNNQNFMFWRHLFTNSIFNSIQQFTPSKVILVIDSRNSWRYDVYTDYKSKRKAVRDKAVVDFEKFFVVYNDFITHFKDTFSKLYVLQVPRSEGDDIIAVLCKEIFNKDQNVVIISADKDMQQLTNKHIKQYDPMNKKFIECLNPQKELDIKIIAGDTSDCIPPIKKRVGEKTAEKILNSGLDVFLNESQEIKDNYIRNKTLIDFNFIPTEIRKNIINTYNEYKINNITGTKIMDFFVQNKLMKIMDQWESSFSDLIKSLE